MNEPTHYYCLRVVSPVHLGCDEAYEPMSFVLDENKKLLTSFDPFDFLRGLNTQEKKTFTEICRKGTIASILEIYKFMRHRNIPGHDVAVCHGLINHYQKTLALPPQELTRNPLELTNFVIQRSAFIPDTSKPYIPGSAIKGALRTAYLNGLAAKKKIPTSGGRNAAQDLERNLLEGGKFATDPFRMLKVSDFTPVGKVKTRIIYAVNRKKNPSTSAGSGLYQILEVIEPGSCFEGYISVLRPEEKAGIKTPLTIDKLFGSAGIFFSKERQREKKELRALGIESPEINSHDSHVVLRIGRHSGAESVTIEGHRNIKITPGGWRNAKFGKMATTLWLAGSSNNAGANPELRPFGWVMIEPMSEEMMEEFKSYQEEQYKKEETYDAGEIAYRDENRDDSAPVKQTPLSSSPIKVANLAVWEKASLVWSPGDQTLTAISGNKKARIKGKELVPECFHKKLFEKKKSVIATVEVEQVGNTFVIVKIEPSDKE